MTIIVLDGPTHIEPQLPKNAPKWPSMEAPPSYHESMELTTAVLSPPIIDYRSGWLIGNPVEETDNRTTNSSRNAEISENRPKAPNVKDFGLNWTKHDENL